ncbi:unnamed protein product, partial [Polarella glacialis]
MLASSRQLRESYSRVLEATLKKVREDGVLTRDAVDELRCRWRKAIERQLAEMEAQQSPGTSLPRRPELGLNLEAPAADAVAVRSAVASLGGGGRAGFSVMADVDFVVDFELMEEVRPLAQ